MSDDIEVGEGDRELSRRKFLKMVGLGAIGVAGALSGLACVPGKEQPGNYTTEIFKGYLVLSPDLKLRTSPEVPISQDPPNEVARRPEDKDKELYYEGAEVVMGGSYMSRPAKEPWLKVNYNGTAVYVAWLENEVKSQGEQQFGTRIVGNGTSYLDKDGKNVDIGRRLEVNPLKVAVANSSK